MKRILHLMFAAFLLIAAGMATPALASDSDDLDLAIEALSDSDSAEGDVMELESDEESSDSEEDSASDSDMESDSMDDVDEDAEDDGEDDDSNDDLDDDDDDDDGTEDGGDGI